MSVAETAGAQRRQRLEGRLMAPTRSSDLHSAERDRASQQASVARRAAYYLTGLRPSPTSCSHRWRWVLVWLGSGRAHCLAGVFSLRPWTA